MKKINLLLTALVCLSLSLGSGMLGCGEEVGICDPCDDQSCDEGWCAAFEYGPDRCVPDDISPSEPYTCQV